MPLKHHDIPVKRVDVMHPLACPIRIRVPNKLNKDSYIPCVWLTWIFPSCEDEDPRWMCVDHYWMMDMQIAEFTIEVNEEVRLGSLSELVSYQLYRFFNAATHLRIVLCIVIADALTSCVCCVCQMALGVYVLTLSTSVTSRL